MIAYRIVDVGGHNLRVEVSVRGITIWSLPVEPYWLWCMERTR